jgi:ribosomal protein S18 acetylase RimI-like enzyme
MEITTATVPSAPPGYHWRPATGSDIPALEDLQRRCNGGVLSRPERTPFETLVTPRSAFQIAPLCAAHRSGKIAAFAATLVYSTGTEDRGELEVLVDPTMRTPTLESDLLDWVEDRARALLRRRREDLPAVLRIAYTDRRDQSSTLYADRGFQLTLLSDTMRRDLRDPIPACCPPDEVTLLPWSHERAALFYQIVDAAFRDRPSASRSSAASWRQALTETPVFRADLSLLLVERAQPAGFIICWIDGPANSRRERSEGWITQIGIHPGREGRGLGTYLLCSVMRELRRQEIDDAMLEVNVSNRRACRLYERLGFTAVARLHVFGKQLTGHHWSDR